MVFYLNAWDQTGDLGRIYIYINSGPGGGEAFAWEWHGPGINTGGRFEWVRRASSPVISLLAPNGYEYATIIGGWQAPAGGEPSRPWFSRADVDEGYGSRSVPEPGPQPLLSAYHWRLA
jgi:hypothetical protein